MTSCPPTSDAPPPAPPAHRGRRRTSRRLGLALAIALPALAVGGTATRPAGAATVPGCSMQPANLTRVQMPAGRSYLLYVPAGLAGREAQGVPLLVSLHGLNSSASQMAAYTGFQADADGRKVVVAYPEGQNETWRIGAGSTDVTFVRNVITDVSRRACIDPRRVHTTGHSMGAYMSQRMACDAGDVVASATEYAGGPLTLAGGTCTVRRPIAIGMFHGTDDRLVRTSLGRQSRDEWVQRDGCPGAATSQPTKDGTLLWYQPCAAGVKVTWHEYPGQGHLWPTGSRATQMVGEMWSLLSAYPMP